MRYAVLVAGMALAMAAPVFGDTMRACNAPCLGATRSEFQACNGAAGAEFQEALDGCARRDPTCVGACRSERQECIDDTDLAAELVGCVEKTQQRKADCRSRFPLGSMRLEHCVDRVQAAGFVCQDLVRKRFRHDVRKCRRAFRPCKRSCGAGLPPLGVKACRSQRREDLAAARADCKATFVATSHACAERDDSCIQDCAAARQVCADPVQATLGAALDACRAAQAQAIAACQAAGGAGVDDCVTTARSDALACREDATGASRAGFGACTQQYLGCVAGCPKR